MSVSQHNMNDPNIPTWPISWSAPLPASLDAGASKRATTPTGADNHASNHTARSTGPFLQRPATTSTRTPPQCQYRLGHTTDDISRVSDSNGTRTAATYKGAQRSERYQLDCCTFGCTLTHDLEMAYKLGTNLEYGPAFLYRNWHNYYL